jgi:hypothetical protein
VTSAGGGHLGAAALMAIAFHELPAESDATGVEPRAVMRCRCDSVVVKPSRSITIDGGLSSAADLPHCTSRSTPIIVVAETTRGPYGGF